MVIVPKIYFIEILGFHFARKKINIFIYLNSSSIPLQCAIGLALKKQNQVSWFQQLKYKLQGSS